MKKLHITIPADRALLPSACDAFIDASDGVEKQSMVLDRYDAANDADETSFGIDAEFRS